jgi:RNA polymerase sigma factor (sigma-70 family)
VYQDKYQNLSLPEQLAEHFNAGLRDRLISYFTRRRMGDTADDLAHEVYLRVWQKLAQGTDIQNVGAYALAVASFVAAEEFRNRSRSVPFSYLSPEEMAKVNRMQDERLNPALPLERKEEQEELRRVFEASFQELPPEDEELLVKYYSRSLKDSRDVLAAELGVSVNNLRVRIYRIRKRLQQSLMRKLKRAKLGQ